MTVLKSNLQGVFFVGSKTTERMSIQGACEKYPEKLSKTRKVQNEKKLSLLDLGGDILSALWIHNLK